MKPLLLSLSLLCLFACSGKKKVTCPGGNPMVVTTAADSIWAFGVDDQNIYWSQSSSEIFKAPLCGGDPTLVSGSHRPEGKILANGDRLYWLEGGGFSQSRLVSMPKSGGDIITLSSGSVSVNSFVAIGDEIYWLTTGTVNDLGTLEHAPAGGAAMTLVVGEDLPGSLTTNGTDLVWIRNGGYIVRTTTVGERPTLLTQSNYAHLPKLVDDMLYFLTKEGDNIVLNRMPADGGSVIQVASSAGGIGDYAAKDSTLYWVNYENSSLMKTLINNKTTTVFAKDLAEMKDLRMASDDLSIVWNSGDGKTINRLSR